MTEYQQRKWWKRQANTVISRKFYGPHKHILRRSTENSSARTQKFFWWSDGINTQHAHAQVHVSTRARVWSSAHLTPILCRLSEFSHQSTRKTLFQNVLSSNTICPIHLELWCLPKECWRFGVFQRSVGALVSSKTFFGTLVPFKSSAGTLVSSKVVKNEHSMPWLTVDGWIARRCPPLCRHVHRWILSNKYLTKLIFFSIKLSVLHV